MSHAIKLKMGLGGAIGTEKKKDSDTLCNLFPFHNRLIVPEL